MKCLELFSGTASFSKEARKVGIECETVDNDPQFHPDICMDINDFVIYPFHSYDIIWASPPCQCFSVASISTHWKGGHRAYIPKTEQCKKAMKLLEHTIFLIWKHHPKYWFIENPRGVMRKVIIQLFRNYGIEYKRHTVTYCQYGDKRMKPTDIWTNCMTWKPKPMCKNGDPCHESAPRGAKTGTQGLKGSVNRSRIPQDLCREIIKAIKGDT